MWVCFVSQHFPLLNRKLPEGWKLVGLSNKPLTSPDPPAKHKQGWESFTMRKWSLREVVACLRPNKIQSWGFSSSNIQLCFCLASDHSNSPARQAEQRLWVHCPDKESEALRLAKVLSTIFILFLAALRSDLFSYLLSDWWALPRAPQQDEAELGLGFPGKALTLDPWTGPTATLDPEASSKGGLISPALKLVRGPERVLGRTWTHLGHHHSRLCSSY